MVEGGKAEARSGPEKTWMPARVMDIGNLDGWQEGLYILRPMDFKTKAGRAWLDANGIFTLRVHGDLSIEIRQAS
jgi:hypothetical protein